MAPTIQQRNERRAKVEEIENIAAVDFYQQKNRSHCYAANTRLYYAYIAKQTKMREAYAELDAVAYEQGI